jgi:hypothetical protein
MSNTSMRIPTTDNSMNTLTRIGFHQLRYLVTFRAFLCPKKSPPGIQKIGGVEGRQCCVHILYMLQCRHPFHNEQCRG